MKVRLDQLLVDRGLAESRQRAQGLIRAGLVVVGEHRVDKPGQKVDQDALLRLKGEVCPYVSRGGIKLAGALQRFGLASLSGLNALDIGASTGGFTDCLLQHGAAHVWAIDTGRGQFHATLRQDPRVTLREEANARFLEPAWIDHQPIHLIAIDVSFISLKLVFPPLAQVIAPGGSVSALVKPQFEAGPADVGKGGVVRDRRVHRRVLLDVCSFARETGWQIRGLCPSPLLGPAGNREFFLWLAKTSQNNAPPHLDEAATEIAIEQILEEAYNSG